MALCLYAGASVPWPWSPAGTRTCQAPCGARDPPPPPPWQGQGTRDGLRGLSPLQFLSSLCEEDRWNVPAWALYSGAAAGHHSPARGMVSRGRQPLLSTQAFAAPEPGQQPFLLTSLCQCPACELGLGWGQDVSCSPRTLSLSWPVALYFKASFCS